MRKGYFSFLSFPPTPLPSDGCWTGAEPESPGPGWVVLGTRPIPPSSCRGQPGPNCAAKANDDSGRWPHAILSTALLCPVYMHGGGVRPQFSLPRPLPGRYAPSSRSPSSTGRKPASKDLVTPRSRGPPIRSKRGRAAHDGRDTGEGTLSIAPDPFTRVAADSEDFVFYRIRGHRLVPAPKAELRLLGLVAATVSA